MSIYLLDTSMYGEHILVYMVNIYLLIANCFAVHPFGTAHKVRTVQHVARTHPQHTQCSQARRQRRGRGGGGRGMVPKMVSLIDNQNEQRNLKFEEKRICVCNIFVFYKKRENDHMVNTHILV